jgi:hypothetical protein|tara:strand:+ start:3122 stop:3577 length:456 start_codon:yes stop_codon:yes gene_type:complete
MKYLVNVVALVLVVLIVIGIIKFKDSDSYYAWQKKTERATKGVSDFMAVRKNNMEMEMSPERQRPLTFIEKEEKLKMFVPTVFDSFTDKSWKDFWNFIYDPVQDDEGALAAKRYREKSEVESYLRYRYPKPFSNFREDHWHYFWEITLGDA